MDINFHAVDKIEQRDGVGGRGIQESSLACGDFAVSIFPGNFLFSELITKYLD